VLGACWKVILEDNLESFLKDNFEGKDKESKNCTVLEHRKKSIEWRTQ
jgi:hypothetical protein